MKFLALYQTLLKKIESGSFHSNEKLPHTLELAKQFNVSHATVFKAMQMLLKEGFIRRIKSKGTFVRPFTKESYFLAQREKRIGLLFRGQYSMLINQHFLGECFVGAEEFFMNKGKKLIPIPMEFKTTEEYVREIEAFRISGAIINSIHLPALHSAIKKMKLPYVCADYLDYNLPADQVTTDHLKAGSISLGKLVELGHKKILFLGNYFVRLRQNDPDHMFWWTAVQSAAKNAHLKNVKSIFLSQQGRLVLKQDLRKFILSNKEYTGYISASPAFYSLIKELLESEAALKGDVRDMVLFTDRPDIRPINGRKVFRCRWDNREMGRKAAEILHSMMEGGPHKPQIHYLPVEIV